MQYLLLTSNIALLGMIAVILVILLTLYSVVTSTGRDRILALLGFLISLCVAAEILVTNSLRNGLITATDWFNWAVYVDFGTRGIYLFLIVIYVTIWAFPDFFGERKWAVIVALIGPIVYEILMYSVWTFSQNIYGPAFWTTGLVLSTLYMALIPLFATIHHTRKDNIRGTSQVKWIWVIFLGLLVWFFGEMVLGVSQLFELPGYLSLSSQGALMIISAQAIGWYLIFVGFVFQARTSQSDTS